MVKDIIWKFECHSACQKNILLSYGTQRFITVFTKSHHRTLSWASRIQFVPSIPISLRPILMLSSHLRLGLPSGLLPSGFPTQTLYLHIVRHFSAMSCGSMSPDMEGSWEYIE
jgi:hypothetical protein